MTKNNKLFDRLFWSGIIGGVFPILFFLIGWWGSIGRVPEQKIFLVAFAGFAWGILLDFLVLNRILNRFYELPMWLMSGIYLFYSICVYGFFMGFPVFNVLLGIPAGMYMGQRLTHFPIFDNKKITIFTSIFTCLVLFLFCFFTAVMALRERTLGIQLSRMLHLPFAFTKPMIWCLIIVGGIGLLILQYFITTFTLKKSLKQKTN